MAAQTRNEILINAPLELVWQMTNDVASWPGLFTEYAQADILEEDERSVLFRLTTQPDEDGKTWSWVSRRIMDPEEHKVHSERVETGPFEYMRIHWTYEELAGGTRMVWMQDFHMQPSAPVDDETMAERINAGSPEQMQAIKRKIEAAAATGDR